MKCFTLLATAIPAGALALAATVSLPKKIIYNASASAPTGFYWLDDKPIKRGDFVVVHVPDHVRNLVIERGLLPPDIPLLKRVAGIEGDEICRDGDDIFIDKMPVATAQKADGLGRPMPIWQGCLTFTENHFFLLQDHPRSFDGRYFGPVHRRAIIARAVKLRFPRRKHDPR